MSTQGSRHRREVSFPVRMLDATVHCWSSLSNIPGVWVKTTVAVFVTRDSCWLKLWTSEKTRISSAAAKWSQAAVRKLGTSLRSTNEGSCRIRYVRASRLRDMGSDTKKGYRDCSPECKQRIAVTSGVPGDSKAQDSAMHARIPCRQSMLYSRAN